MAFRLQRFKPAGYTVAAMFVSLGGLLNGFDTGSIGAVTSMKQFSNAFGVLSPTLRGFTVSLIMLTGAAPSLFAGQIADKWGRLNISFIGATTFLAGVLLQVATENLKVFLVGRAIAGFGQGLWLPNIVVYIAEISPSAKRGALVSVPQFCVCAGIFLSYFLCYGSQHIESSLAWRVPYIAMAVIALVLAVACKLLPDSPRWLVLHGRREEAIRGVEKLGIHREEAEKDILKTQEGEQNRLSSGVQSFLMPFRKQYRFRTILALFVLGMVQLSGIDGVLYYAPVLFHQAGLPEQTAGFLASGISAILFLLISIPAVIYADSWSRRTSIMTGGFLLTGCMVLIGALYASGTVHAYGVGRWVVVVAIYIFGMTYAATWGIMGKIVASEIVPAKTRAGANSVAQGLGFLTNWLVAFAMPVFLAKSSYGPYFLFGGFSLFTVLVLAVYLPETRGVSLEEVEGVFQRPLRGWKNHLKRIFGSFASNAGRSSSSGSHSSIELSSTTSAVNVEAFETTGA